MHVTHLHEPTPGRWYRPLRIEPQGCLRMAEAVRGSFARDAHGAPVPLVGKDCFDDDTFYEAHGTYNAFRTSSQWTSDMLAIAGITIGVWTSCGVSQAASGLECPLMISELVRGSAHAHL